jgi:hypothetical protein
MKTAITTLLLAVAAAACSPDEGISTAQAQHPAASITTVTYPEIAQGAADGQVYEYY